MLQVVIDRIEDKIAVLEIPVASMVDEEEYGEIYVWADDLPAEAQEGNVLDVTFRINKEEEARRIQEVKELQDKLLKTSQ